MGHNGHIFKGAVLVAIIPVDVVSIAVSDAGGNVGSLIPVAGAIVLQTVEDQTGHIGGNFSGIDILAVNCVHLGHGNAGPAGVGADGAAPVVGADIAPQPVVAEIYSVGSRLCLFCHGSDNNITGNQSGRDGQSAVGIGKAGDCSTANGNGDGCGQVVAFRRSQFCSVSRAGHNLCRTVGSDICAIEGDIGRSLDHSIDRLAQCVKGNDHGAAVSSHRHNIVIRGPAIRPGTLGCDLKAIIACGNIGKGLFIQAGAIQTHAVASIRRIPLDATQSIGASHNKQRRIGGPIAVGATPAGNGVAVLVRRQSQIRRLIPDIVPVCRRRSRILSDKNDIGSVSRNICHIYLAVEAGHLVHSSASGTLPDPCGKPRTGLIPQVASACVQINRSRFACCRSCCGRQQGQHHNQCHDETQNSFQSSVFHLKDSSSILL